MLYTTLKLLHLLAVVVWVGGMVFAHGFLRPALTVLPPPQRLQLMHAVLGRFFAAVALAAGVTLASGLWMIGDLHQRVAATGGSLQMPWSWTAMAAIGLVMTGIFAWIRLALFPRLARAVAAGEFPAAAAALAPIRRWVSVNLVLGLVVIVLVGLGRG
jgi:uncharacterized membrane protein